MRFTHGGRSTRHGGLGEVLLSYFPQVYLPEAGKPGAIHGLIRRGGSLTKKHPSILNQN
jgi:hypothetical protein